MIFTNEQLLQMDVNDIIRNSDMYTGEKLSHREVSHGRGIYLLYTFDDKLLYLGKSENMKPRIRTHLSGRDGSTGKFSKFISKIRIIYVDWDINQQNLFRVERWFIGNLRPAFNGPIHESWADSYKSFYARLKEATDDQVVELINEWGVD